MAEPQCTLFRILIILQLPDKLNPGTKRLCHSFTFLLSGIINYLAGALSMSPNSDKHLADNLRAIAETLTDPKDAELVRAYAAEISDADVGRKEQKPKLKIRTRL